MIGGAARVAEPDATLGLDLAKIRAAIRGKDERDCKPMPGTSCEFTSFHLGETARVPFRLVNGRRDILALPFCLNEPDQGRPDE
jgi:hypothetical protein